MQVTLTLNMIPIFVAFIFTTLVVKEFIGDLGRTAENNSLAYFLVKCVLIFITVICFYYTMYLALIGQKG